MKLVLALALFAASASALKDGAGNGVAKSTYACQDPSAGKAFLLKYLPVSTADDECTNDVCTCTTDGTWEIQQGRVALNSYSIGNGVSPGFGFHLVNVSARETTGGYTVKDVEDAFTTRMGDMSAYDNVMDFNIGLYVSDLDSYTSSFDSDSVSYLPLTYEADGSTWYSAIVQVPDSHMVLEIMSDSSSMIGAEHHTTEARLSPSLARRTLARKADILAHHNFTAMGVSASTTSMVIKVSRGATDLDAIDSFYTSALGASLDYSDSGDSYETHCFKYTTSSDVDVCFTKRDDNTGNDWTVASNEQSMFAVHANLLTNPNCAMDKWLDNHHAYDSQSSSTGTAAVSYLSNNPDTYYYCEEGALHYIIDPTGWGIQTDFMFQSNPSGCSSRAIFTDNGGNPACSLGTC